MCPFDYRVRLELFIIRVREPLSYIHLIRPLLTAMKKLSVTTKHQALGFQNDGWSCGFHSLNITKLAVKHRGYFSNVPLVPIGTTCLALEIPEAKTQPSMATPTDKDARAKVLIHGGWRKVPDGYPTDAYGQLERDQLFIIDLAKHLVAELRAACQLNPKSKIQNGL